MLFFPMLIAPGGLAADLPHDSPLLTFAQALQDLFFVEGSAKIDQALYLVAQICLVWSLISLGFFLLTPGKTFLHDLISGAFLFSFSRRKGIKDDAPPGRTKPADNARKTPPQIQPDPKPAPIAHQGGPPPIPKDAIFPGPMQQPVALFPAHRPKSPRLAMVLSLFPGLGQFYNGDFMKGLLILLTFWLIIPWFLGIFDAYFKACWINRQAGFTN